MRFFDRDAFLRGVEEMDEGTLLEDFNEIGIVATAGMKEDEKEALGKFIKFVAQADGRDADGEPSAERLTFLELLEIARHLNSIVQALSGDSPGNIYRLAWRLKNIKNNAGMRRVI